MCRSKSCARISLPSVFGHFPASERRRLARRK
jgi:hypothetical protein